MCNNLENYQKSPLCFSNVHDSFHREFLEYKMYRSVCQLGSKLSFFDKFSIDFRLNFI